MDDSLAPDSGKDAATYVRPLTAAEWVWSKQLFRKALILVVLALVWEIYARILDAELLMPTLTADRKSVV